GGEWGPNGGPLSAAARVQHFAKARESGLLVYKHGALTRASAATTAVSPSRDARCLSTGNTARLLGCPGHEKACRSCHVAIVRSTSWRVSGAAMSARDWRHSKSSAASRARA